MGGEINIDVGSAIPYFVDKFLGWFGKDATSQEDLRWFSELQRISYHEASTVQCIGMHSPVPIKEVYQPTRLSRPQASYEPERIYDFLKRRQNVIVKAGPGFGKTTFLHYVYFLQNYNQNVLPVLFSLRRTQTVSDLTRFVDICASKKKFDDKEKGKEKKRDDKEKKLDDDDKEEKTLGKERRILLLVDGYDEITVEDRKLVSDALLRFSALDLGYFYLTCREFYDVYYLKANVAHITPFTHEDQLKFITSFLHIYQVDLDPVSIIEEMEFRGLQTFLSHPLLLVLVCIVKSNPSNSIANNVVELASTAIDTLSWRWDTEKGVHREALTPLNGKSRVDLLSWLAFKLIHNPSASPVVMQQAEAYLKRLPRKNIDWRRVLQETAGFYGIFVPVEAGWTFVHAVLHDYLAARFWVSSGGFRPASVKTWNTRAAYAACLQPDATRAMKQVLKKMAFETFADILMNSTIFDQGEIVALFLQSVINRNKKVRARDPATREEYGYLRYASSHFLDLLIRQIVSRHEKRLEKLLSSVFFAVLSRGEPLEESTFQLCEIELGLAAEFEKPAGFYVGPNSLRLKDMAPSVFQKTARLEWQRPERHR